jgi:hypothetical protein
MTLFIALLLLHSINMLDPLTIAGTVLLWIVHLTHKSDYTT